VKSKSQTKSEKASFRQAEIADVHDILDMMKEFYEIDQYLFDKKLSAENLYIFLQNGDLGRLWMIQLQNETVGYVVLTFGFSFEYGGRDAFIDELFIKKPFRNQGIGDSSIKLVLEEAKSLDIKAVHLEVESHNEGGIKLYTKHSFGGNNRKLLTHRIS